MIDKYDEFLRDSIEDIVLAWSWRDGASWEVLVDNLHDFVLEKYGPPF